jgi:hypothetical protein
MHDYQIKLILESSCLKYLLIVSAQLNQTSTIDMIPFIILDIYLPKIIFFYDKFKYEFCKFSLNFIFIVNPLIYLLFKFVQEQMDNYKIYLYHSVICLNFKFN